MSAGTDPEEGVEEWTAELGEAAVVFTAEFCPVFGGCHSCPGIATAETIGEGKLPGDTTVWCTPWCHQVATAV